MESAESTERWRRCDVHILRHSTEDDKQSKNGDRVIETHQRAGDGIGNCHLSFAITTSHVHQLHRKDCFFHL
jgi:hypothetical protein